VERQLVLFRYAMFAPKRVQLEQVVSDVHAMHFGSQELHRLGFVEEYFPVGQEETQTLLSR
jgi:hypothetical protein